MMPVVRLRWWVSRSLMTSSLNGLEDAGRGVPVYAG
jgi:hypothetical protein